MTDSVIVPRPFAPLIVVTGLTRSGINLIGDMLHAGGIEGAESPDRPGYIYAIDPHINPYPRPPSRTIGILIERSLDAIAAAVNRDAALENRALDRCEMLALKNVLARNRIAARDRAASLFGPVFSFDFGRIIANPHDESQRLARVLREHYPAFCSIKAALAVRRIRKLPRLVTAVRAPVSMEPTREVAFEEREGAPA